MEHLKCQKLHNLRNFKVILSQKLLSIKLIRHEITEKISLIKQITRCLDFFRMELKF
jgi:hypothetical protein